MGSFGANTIIGLSCAVGFGVHLFTRKWCKSAGYINEKPLQELCQFLDAANIDLKSFDDRVYAKLNAGKLEPILNTLKILKENNVWVEITNLIVPNWTDSLDMIRKMCRWLVANGLEDCPLHFSRFHPQYKLKQLPPTPVGILEQARKTAIENGMKFAYVGNMPGTQYEDTFCPECQKVLIERKGYRIIQNHIHNSLCGFCTAPVAGVW